MSHRYVCLWAVSLLRSSTLISAVNAEYFKKAMNSNPRTPLQCCKRMVPIDFVARDLGPAFVDAYKLLQLEWSTPHPLYCSNKNCNLFVPPGEIHGDNGMCSKCGTQTCRHCRANAHPGVLCKKDQETARVQKMGEKAGWKPCPGYGHLISRQNGCLHMTCSQCSTNFCYRCGKKSCVDGKCK